MQERPDIVETAPIRNRLHHWIGAGVLLANKLRYSVRPYCRARDFSADDVSRAADYDFGVVEGWLEDLAAYDGSGVNDKVVLELGPGPDLGTGVILLAGGARRYVAMDVNGLAARAPASLYDELLRRIAARGDVAIDVKEIAVEVERAVAGQDGRLDYRCRKDFNISTIGSGSVDIIFSQAAFEHFDDIRTVAAQSAQVARAGAVMIARIDLRTHTRWLRPRDPLNIYRYSPRMYRRLTFRGSPNRLRPRDYVAAFADGGWSDIRVQAISVLSDDYIARVQPTLAQAFRDGESQMAALSIVLCARRGQ